MRSDEIQTNLQPNLEEAIRFLSTLGGEPWTFQTFADRKDAAVHPRIIHATGDTLSQVLMELWAENRKRAGVFMCVNQTDGQGRQALNIKLVRAVFVDLDGAPLENIERIFLKPHIIVETSPARYHAYWLVEPNFPPAEFRTVQKRLAALTDGDPKVSDLSRVMRVPGFWHLKQEPFLTRILDMEHYSQ